MTENAANMVQKPPPTMNESAAPSYQPITFQEVARRRGELLRELLVWMETERTFFSVRGMRYAAERFTEKIARISAELKGA